MASGACIEFDARRFRLPTLEELFQLPSAVLAGAESDERKADIAEELAEAERNRQQPAGGRPQRKRGKKGPRDDLFRFPKCELHVKVTEAWMSPIAMARFDKYFLYVHALTQSSAQYNTIMTTIRLVPECFVIKIAATHQSKLASAHRRVDTLYFKRRRLDSTGRVTYRCAFLNILEVAIYMRDNPRPYGFDGLLISRLMEAIELLKFELEARRFTTEEASVEWQCAWACLGLLSVHFSQQAFDHYIVDPGAWKSKAPELLDPDRPDQEQRWKRPFTPEPWCRRRRR